MATSALINTAPDYREPAASIFCPNPYRIWWSSDIEGGQHIFLGRRNRYRNGRSTNGLSVVLERGGVDMGNAQSSEEAPKEIREIKEIKETNRLSKPRTNNSSSNLLTAGRHRSSVISPSLSPQEESETDRLSWAINRRSTRAEIRAHIFEDGSENGAGQTLTADSVDHNASDILSETTADNSSPEGSTTHTSETGSGHGPSLVGSKEASLDGKVDQIRQSMDEKTMNTNRVSMASFSPSSDGPIPRPQATSSIIRRRSLLQTPGIATRTFRGHKKSLSTQDGGNHESRAEAKDRRYSEPPTGDLRIAFDSADAGRCSTPSEFNLSLGYLGSLKPGTLHVVNGNASPAASERSHVSKLSNSKQPETSYFSFSEAKPAPETPVSMATTLHPAEKASNSTFFIDDAEGYFDTVTPEFSKAFPVESSPSRWSVDVNTGHALPDTRARSSSLGFGELRSDSIRQKKQVRFSDDPQDSKFKLPNYSYPLPTLTNSTLQTTSKRTEVEDNLFDDEGYSGPWDEEISSALKNISSGGISPRSSSRVTVNSPDIFNSGLYFDRPTHSNSQRRDAAQGPRVTRQQSPPKPIRQTDSGYSSELSIYSLHHRFSFEADAAERSAGKTNLMRSKSSSKLESQNVFKPLPPLPPCRSTGFENTSVDSDLLYMPMLKDPKWKSHQSFSHQGSTSTRPRRHYRTQSESYVSRSDPRNAKSFPRPKIGDRTSSVPAESATGQERGPYEHAFPDYPFYDPQLSNRKSTPDYSTSCLPIRMPSLTSKAKDSPTESNSSEERVKQALTRIRSKCSDIRRSRSLRRNSDTASSGTSTPAEMEPVLQSRGPGNCNSTPRSYSLQRESRKELSISTTKISRSYSSTELTRLQETAVKPRRTKSIPRNIYLTRNLAGNKDDRKVLPGKLGRTRSCVESTPPIPTMPSIAEVQQKEVVTSSLVSQKTEVWISSKSTPKSTVPTRPQYNRQPTHERDLGRISLPKTHRTHNRCKSENAVPRPSRPRARSDIGKLPSNQFSNHYYSGLLYDFDRDCDDRSNRFGSPSEVPISLQSALRMPVAT
ncbi:MAG: hypothetical protein M1834_003643 [Cirrosporium novae-zelandiae]|nr:MAG: hypothetical protein M1834_003643 [Cirrosporium novae-zelandiae]